MAPILKLVSNKVRAGASRFAARRKRSAAARPGMTFVDKYGRVQDGPSPARASLSANQRMIAVVIGVLILPSLALRGWRQHTSEQGVDLSRFTISKEPFDTPALEKRDGVLRIEFCTS